MTAPIKISASFVETELDDETVVMQIDTGDFFSLTDSAKSIWSLIDGTRGKAELIEALCSQYGADRDVVAADVETFLGQLSEAGLLASG
ncbi:MAG: HPr-rel-A system PqqD family peptide chaperone [Novosphingobium sp.]